MQWRGSACQAMHLILKLSCPTGCVQKAVLSLSAGMHAVTAQSIQASTCSLQKASSSMDAACGMAACALAPVHCCFNVCTPPSRSFFSLVVCNALVSYMLPLC